MDCKLVRRSISVSETIYEGSGEQPIDAELTLPDYCTDVGKILKCYAVPRVTSRSLRGDSLTAEGVTRIVVLYCGGRSGGVNCYEHELPFSCVYRTGETPDGAKADITVSTQYVNCRAVSPRKLDIHGAVSVSVKVTAKKDSEIVSGITGAGVKTKCETVNVSSLAASAQGSFTVSDTLEVGTSAAAIGGVIRNDAVITLGECRAIANKLMVNGTAKLTFVYCGESGEGVQRTQFDLDFSELIDVPGIDDECRWDAQVQCSGVDIGLRTDSDGEYRRMNVDIHCFASVKAYKDMEISVANDAYSVEYEIETQRRPITLESYKGVISENITVSRQLDTGGVLFSAIDDVRCVPEDVNIAFRSGKALINGTVSVGILGRDSEGKSVYCEKNVPVESEHALQEQVTSPRFEKRVNITGCSYVLAGAGRPEVRINAVVDAAVYDEMTLLAIDSVTADESRPKKNDGTLVLYFADEGESLWDIAREYNSGVEDIMAENDMEDDRIKEKTMLLIAR